MKQVMITSAAGLRNAPIEPSRVENPPVAMVVMAWAIASKPFSPASQSNAAQIAVRAR